MLVFGSEVWVCENFRDVDIFHRNFLHIVIKKFKFTPNCMLYDETESTDIKSKIHKRTVNFCAKLKFGTTGKLSSLMRQLLSKLQTDNPDNPAFKWIGSVRNILNGMRFSYIYMGYIRIEQNFS